MVEPPAHNRIVPGSSPGGPKEKTEREEGHLKEQIGLLLELHELDLQIRKLQTAIDVVGPELEELRKLVSEHEATLATQTAKITELEAGKRSRERDVEAAEFRLKNFQEKLSMIKTNKEYQAALKEISETKKSNKLLEDQIVEAMTQLETLGTAKKEVESYLSSARANFSKRQSEIEAEVADLKGKKSQIEARKLDLEGKVDRDVIVLYRRVRKGRAEGMAAVVGGSCHGCRMKVPPQLMIEILKLQKVHACPNCQRILYLNEWVETKETNPDHKKEPHHESEITT
jgi:predicted  nucleic acid-binding Zn-ribbon protein